MAEAPSRDELSQDRIRTLRNEIDRCDEAIIELIRHRMAVSQQIGEVRKTTGGPRLSLGRENEVLARYQDALGPDGAALAMALLRQGRGRL